MRLNPLGCSYIEKTATNIISLCALDAMEFLTRAEMTELDRLMIEEIGIDVPRMMEYAGLFPAQLAMKVSSGKRILVLSGHGNNGGDGLCCARHLKNFGYDVRVILARDKLTEHAQYQLSILEKIGISPLVYSGEQFAGFDLIIDSLIGYNLKGNPRGVYSDIIKAANTSNIPILSIDIPSGLDADLGHEHDPCIKAAYTIALSGVKKGCIIGKKSVGELYLAYLSVPSNAYKKIGKKAPVFTDAIKRIYL